MSHCIIHLDNFQGSYFHGSQIIGRVICTFTKDESPTGIQVVLKGLEHTDWSKSESGTINFIGNNEFLSLNTILAAKGHQPPVNNEYPFTINLPKNIPGTYRGKTGWVKYHLRALVDTTLSHHYEQAVELNVVALIDFNEIEDQLLLHPSVYEDDAQVYCCHCDNAPITMKLHLDKEAFAVQEEVVKLRVELTNWSCVLVDRFEAKLYLNVESFATAPIQSSTVESELIATEYVTETYPHRAKSYDFILQVPRSTIIPNFTACKLFKQWGSILITGHVAEGCQTSMNIEARITLGHIALGGQLQQPTYPGYGYAPPLGVPYMPPSGQAAYLPPAPVHMTNLLPNAPPQQLLPTAPGDLQAIGAGENSAFLPGRPAQELPPPSYQDVLYKSK